jgi:hypothetical protein
LKKSEKGFEMSFSELRTWVLLVSIFGYSDFVAAVRADPGDCHINRFHFFAGADTLTAMTVRQGKICMFHMEIPNSAVGLVGILSSVTTEPPKHGVLGKHTVRMIAYKPADGYTGTDHFEIRVRYNGDDGKGDEETQLKVDVNVF